MRKIRSRAAAQLRIAFSRGSAYHFRNYEAAASTLYNIDRVPHPEKGLFMRTLIGSASRLSRASRTASAIAVGLALLGAGIVAAWELGPAPTQTDRRITNIVTRYLRTEHL